MEQAENISDEKLQEVAHSLEVTYEGSRDFSEKKVLYNTNNFHENSGVFVTNIAANIETVNNLLKEMIETFERQLEIARKEFLDILKSKQ